MTLPQHDADQFDRLSQQVESWCQQFLQGLAERPAAWLGHTQLDAPMPEQGLGASSALQRFYDQVAPALSGSTGPRYLGFVTGGVTPAALLADRLVSTVDQNVALPGDSIANAVEQQALAWLRQLLQLPDHFSGLFTTGATSANLLGLLCGRQHAGLQQGLDIAADGMAGARIRVYAATPHASTLKSAALAGLGRNSLVAIDCLPGSEAMDTRDLATKLAADNAYAKIVVASVGTVTGTDFDDLPAIAALCRQHGAWLHADGAFGLFARLLEDRAPWTAGIELADSITTDCHKWLNVPYDCGVFLTRHPDLLRSGCAVASSYLVTDPANPAAMEMGIENSRRFRALPVWLSLAAYGRDGFRQIVANNCNQATALAAWIDASPHYQLCTPCKLNVVVFRPLQADTDSWLQRLNSRGQVFMTPGQWQGQAAIRAAFSNWRTTDADVSRVIDELAALTDG